jgi:DNA-binding PadR family transcriptional regulator
MEESETGREAKFYSITKKGRRQMDAEVVNWSGSSTLSTGFPRPLLALGPEASY